MPPHQRRLWLYASGKPAAGNIKVMLSPPRKRLRGGFFKSFQITNSLFLKNRQKGEIVPKIEGIEIRAKYIIFLNGGRFL